MSGNNKLIMKKITEDTNVSFKQYTELSYKDNGSTNVTLLISNKEEGKCKVWQDAEQDKREYIILNNEIIYLDTITKL